MKSKLPGLMQISRRITALILACTMIFNFTSEAAAQYRSFSPTGGGVPPFDYKAPADNTRVASKDLEVKLTQAKLKSEATNLKAALSYQEVKQSIQNLYKELPLPESVIQAIYNEYLKEVNKQDKEVNQVFNLLKNEYHIESAFSEAYKQGNQSGKVCEGKVCFAYNNYIQGILRAEVYQGVGDDSSSKQYKWNREIMLAHVPAIYDAIEIAGVHRADQAKVQRYLRYVLAKASDYCDNDTYLVDIMPGLGYSFNGKSNGKKSDAQQGKERRRKQCEAVGKAMTALGIVGETGQDKLTNSSIIYNIMKDTYKDDYGAITAVSGVSALIAVGTVGSYKYIDRFLTVDTLKGATDFGTVWNGCKWVLGLLSIQSWVEKGTTVNNKLRGRGGRYLNQLGAVYQYIDEDASRAMGVSSYQLGVMKTNPSLGYNIAYGNVLEDLGRMISSTGTKQGNAIAARILAIYTSNVKTYGSAMNYVHTPLVAGVLSTGTIKGATAQYAAQKMNALDWWDLNEATQRRVNNIVAKYSGTQSRSKDAAKIKRNERNQKIIQASVWADMAVSAIFMGMLIASIPNMARSIGSFVSNLSRIRAINAAGKANLLKITRVRIKALPVKPAQIKAALNVKRIEAARDAETLRVARAAEAKSAALKSATEKIRKAKAPKGKPQTEQIQYTLLTKEGKAVLANQNGTLTAVVGEGGSGASATAKTLTLSEKVAIAKRMATEQAAADARATLEAQTLEKETAAAIANQKPFKGNMLFNKPYKQLSPWRKWAFDTYYFKLNPAFKLTGQVTTGLARNPVKTTMMGSLPFGTTAEALVANPIGIYTTVSQQANSFSSIVNLAQEASTFGQVAKTVNTIGKIHNAVQPMTAAQSAMAMGGMLSLPRLVAVLNEPHTGSTGSMRIKGGSGNYSYAPAATAAKTEAVEATQTAKEEAVPNITPVAIETPKAEPVKATVKAEEALAYAEDQAFTAPASSYNFTSLPSVPLLKQEVKSLEVMPAAGYYKKNGKYSNYESREDAKAKLKEEQSIASAWNRIQRNPEKGKTREVVASISANGKTFVIHHGAAVRDMKTGKLVIQGKLLKKHKGTFDNFGLTKIIFKHGEGEVLPVNSVTKADVTNLPSILRNYNPVTSESSDKRLVYRVANNKGILLAVFSKMAPGKYMLVTMFYETAHPSQNVEYSSRRIQSNFMTAKTAAALQAKVANSSGAAAANNTQRSSNVVPSYNLLPEGWKLTNETLSTPNNLIAETRVENNFIKEVPQTTILNTADPVFLSSMFLLPIIMKVTGRNYKVATNQSLTIGQQPSSADDLFGGNDNDANKFNFTDGGFLLAYEDPNNPGKEIVLPVDLDIDNSFKTKGYNRVFFNKEGIAELRNNTKPAKTMSGFFMKLNGTTEDFAEFISLAKTAELEGNLKIKVMQVGKRRSVKTAAVKLYTENLSSLPVEVELPASIIGPSDTLIMLENGELAILKAGETMPQVIDDYYVRLPKNQINNLVSILKDSPRRFAIEIGTTKDKAGVVIREVSMTNVSLGKTFAPVVKTSLGMSEANATSLMFIINYLLPGLSSFLNPVLKKVGERKLLLLSLILSLSAGIIATSSGFYGFVDSMPHSEFRKYAFITAVSLMAIAGILKQLVSNMLIRANRGDAAATKTTSADNKAAKKATEQAQVAPAKVNLKDVKTRMKEVFTKKSELSLQDAFFYNLSFMFKNFGTLLFLAMPYAVSEIIRLFSGVDLKLDYSLSFPIYAVFSATTLWKTYNAHLRDAYDTKPQVKESVRAAANQASLSVAEFKRQQAAKEKEAAAAKAEQNGTNVQGEPAAKKENGVIDVFLHKQGVMSVSAAMALATIHEFVLSSSFASILKATFDSSAAANFWVSLCLYIPLVTGRLLGNVAGQRMSPSSLYIVCSALSALGTAMVASFVGSPVAVMLGASIASLGVGNFFTQMYNYLTDKHKEYNREISIILALTMSAAALGALPAQYLVQATGIQNISLIYSMVCLAASLILTTDMMKGSTLYKYIQQAFGSSKATDKTKGQEQQKSSTPKTDINNPLHN